MSAFVVNQNHINYITSYLVTEKLISKSEAKDIAQYLLDENYRSVLTRYSHNSEAREYFGKSYSVDFQMVQTEDVQAYQAWKCYNYQACETDDYQTTRYYALFEIVKKYIETKVPNVETILEQDRETYDWEIDTVTPLVETFDRFSLLKEIANNEPVSYKPTKDQLDKEQRVRNSIVMNALGGKSNLVLMVGAKEFYYDSQEKSLFFKFTRSNGVNYFKAIYNPGSDMFTVQFLHVTRQKMTVKHEFVDLPLENFKETFESVTGLYLTIPTVGKAS